MLRHFKFIFLLLLASLFGYYALSLTGRFYFRGLFSLFSLLFIVGLGVYYSERDQPNSQVAKYTVFAILLRLTMFSGLPELSDDFYRFLWDGHVSQLGLNPYLHLPVELYKKGILQTGFENLNSPGYFTVYPPLNQWIFEFAVSWDLPVSAQVNILRVILFCGEMLTLILLPKVLRLIGLPVQLSLLYFFNPLVIIEVLGNVHFEGLTVAFVLVAVYWYKTGRTFMSSLAYGMAISVKLLPLIFIPLILARLGWKKGLTYVLPALLINVLFFVPYFDPALFTHLYASIDLYFHSFEFNAGIFYLLREAGMHLTGYNQIHFLGTVLGIVIVVLGMVLAYLLKKGKLLFFTSLLLFTITYYLFSTTVHPWYIINVLIFGLLSGYWRTAFVWTFTVFLSYESYGHVPVTENSWLLVLEYGSLIVVGIYEFLYCRPEAMINDK